MAERGVAPALVPRTHKSGTPGQPSDTTTWVCLRWLYGERTNGGESLRDQGAEEAAVRSLVARPRGAKSPQWSAERRASGDPDARAARRDLIRALLGAPLPRVCEGRWNEGAPRALQTTGAAERWLFALPAV